MAGLTIGMDAAAPPATLDAPRTSGWRRRLGWAAVALLALSLAVAMLLTSGEPWVGERGAPTAEQVSAGHGAVLRLRSTPMGGERVAFERAELDGAAALVNHVGHGRFDVSFGDDLLLVTVSRELPLGRWLNVRAELVPEGASFPAVRLRIGALPLSPGLSRAALDVAHWTLRRRGADLPELDRMVRGLEVGRGEVAARLFLPRAPEVVGQVVGQGLAPVDAAAVAAAYCRLADRQRREPSTDFAAQVNRAFAGGQAGPAANRAALVALGMLVVDSEVGRLAGTSGDAARACRIDPVAATLHGRPDLAKHWALSAALAATTGTRFAEAVGEWKELADTLPSGSGFSFVDLAADRAGFRAARAAADPDGAARAAAFLARAGEDALLPEPLTRGAEGLSDDAFRGGYGGIDDRRYARVVARIDGALDRRGAL